MKKCCSLLLILFMLISCVACSQASEEKADAEENVVDLGQEEEMVADKEEVDKKEFLKDATIKEQVILDKKDFTITAKSLKFISYAAVLDIIIENKSDKNLSFVTASNAYSENAVNGIKVEEGYSNCDVAAGETKTKDLYFKFEGLIPLGINKIETIEIGFRVTDDDTYDELYRGVSKVQVDSPKESSKEDDIDFGVNNETDNNGINSEFKAKVDAYKEFIDEYVGFMEKYQLNPEDESLQTEYANISSEYEKRTKEFEELENEELNAAEKAYYASVELEVTVSLFNAGA